MIDFHFGHHDGDARFFDLWWILQWSLWICAGFCVFCAGDR
jgi:hypothetical protein